jgi:hypothetical protein
MGKIVYFSREGYYANESYSANAGWDSCKEFLKSSPHVSVSIKEDVDGMSGYAGFPPRFEWSGESYRPPMTADSFTSCTVYLYNDEEIPHWVVKAAQNSRDME